MRHVHVVNCHKHEQADIHKVYVYGLKRSILIGLAPSNHVAHSVAYCDLYWK